MNTYKLIIKSSHHHIIKSIFTFSHLLILTFSNAQYYPQNYFQSPLDTPLYLSAPFGSLRENHFHSGMDIRTYEKEGYPVYAVANGFVSRIKVSSVGYGKAVYIQHPNGFTSVYGHLKKYEGAIADYVKNVQYRNETFEFDNFPGSGTIKIKKGQIIGWSGNSGGSTGPHLHFEIRDSRTEEPLNPQLFGIRGVDFMDPVIKKIVVYDLDGNRPLILKKFSVSKKNSTRIDSILLYNDTLEIDEGMVGFGVEAYDYMTDTEHEYSLYGMDLFVDEKEFFSYRLDRIDFENTRCVNVHIDYEQYKRNDIRYQKCFLDNGNIYN
ncbi:MAG: M23 family metallopeptidase, partial [Bacteroidia bacterium]